MKKIYAFLLVVFGVAMLVAAVYLAFEPTAPKDVVTLLKITGALLVSLLAAGTGIKDWLELLRKDNQLEQTSKIDIFGDSPQVATGINGRNIQTGGGDYFEKVEHYYEAERTSPPKALHQLPPLHDDFIGREKEVADILSIIRSGSKSLCIHGMGGIGKTTIALQIAQLLTPQYPDGQIFLDMKGVNENVVSAVEAITYIINSWYPQINLPKDELELRSLYLSVLYEKRVLLLIDNVRDKSQIELLIPPNRCFFLVTSRQRFTLPGQKIVYIKELDSNDSVSLLVNIAPRLIDSPSSDRVTNDILRIVELCGHLPLAIRIIASTLAERVDLTTEEVIKQLEESKNRLKLTGVDASLRLSYKSLTRKQQKLWRMLGVFPDDFDTDAATGIWNAMGKVRRSDPNANMLTSLLRLKFTGTEHITKKPSLLTYAQNVRISTKDQLSRFVQYSLVEYNSKTNRYKLHDLSRLYAISLISKRLSIAVQKRRIIHYMNFLYEIENQYSNSKNMTKGLSLFAQEKSNIISAQAWAQSQIKKDREMAKICRDFPYVSEHILRLQLPIADKVYWYESALLALNYLEESDPLTKIRSTLMHFFRYDERIGFIFNLGMAYRDKGELDKSLEYLNQTLEYAQSRGYTYMKVGALNGLGLTYYALGDIKKAITFHEECISLSRKTGDQEALGGTLVNLGLANMSLGNAPRAINLYKEALIVLQKFSPRNIEFEGNATRNLGLAYSENKEYLLAAEYFEKALNLYEEIGAYRHQVDTLVDLARTYANLDKINEGKQYCIQALKLYKSYINDIWVKGDLLNRLGVVHVDLKDSNQAIEIYEQALQVYKSIENRKGESFVLNNFGEAYAQLGEIDQALKFYEESLSIKRSLKIIWAEAYTLYNIALAFNQAGDHTNARIRADMASTLIQKLSVSDLRKVKEKLEAWENINDINPSQKRN